MVRWAWVGAAALAVACGGKSGSEDDGGAGSGGESGSYVIEQVRQGGRTKLDLLVMVDSSQSMADKQRYLAEAIPVLLSRLVTPICVNEDGLPVGGTSPNCPNGSRPELEPMKDIHLGVITSSIGDHGSDDLCAVATAAEGETPDDKAMLIPLVRPALQSWDDSGFLVWDPRGGGAVHEPPGYGSPLAGSPGTVQDLVSAFTDHVRSAGERGCGHEAQLESWYRFLVDPEPVSSMSNDGALSVRGPVNEVVLEQRGRFLRTDSLLAIIMLTDENDCSFTDENGTQAWLAMYTGGATVNEWYMPRARSTCADPNSPSCAPCTYPFDSDPACAAGSILSLAEDHPNLRCYRMKERFGVDMKYPIARYVDALTKPTVDPRDTGQPVPNPIFAAGPNGQSRTQSDVVMLGIVGVPWQDIATEGDELGQPNSLQPGRALQFMTAAELEERGRWDLILGKDGNPPLDPFMVESIDPRPIGAGHPFLDGVKITAPGGTPNAINGTEQAVQANNRFDLQFACTFPLEPAVPCTDENARGCLCNVEEAAQQSPLCEYATQDSDGVQVRNKAYPSVRELELLRELGSSAVVASICPKNIAPEGGNPSTDPYYGYNPAMTALFARLEQSVGARCLSREVAVNDGRVACTVMEVTLRPDGCGSCDPTLGRRPLAGAGLRSALEEEMQLLGLCGPGPGVPCEHFCACELQQLEGSDLVTCQNASTLPSEPHGYCYVDEENGAPALLSTCPAGSKRILRFTGDDTPAEGALVFVACR